MVRSKDHCQVHVPERFSELQHTGHPNCKHIVEGTSFVSFLVVLEVASWKVAKMLTKALEDITKNALKATQTKPDKISEKFELKMQQQDTKLQQQETMLQHQNGKLRKSNHSLKQRWENHTTQ